jgi:hypothetical protein
MGYEKCGQKRLSVGKRSRTNGGNSAIYVNMYIKFKIWKYKLAGFIPRNNSIINDVRDWLEKLCMYHKWRMMLPLVRRLIVL